jgi:hypothetical protein
MKARIAPRPVGVRTSRLNRLGTAVRTKRDSFPASGLPCTGIEEVTKRSSVPSGPSDATAVVRTRPAILRAASVPGMAIDPGKLPADTTSAGMSGIWCKACSIFASRSSTATSAVGAGAAFAIASRRLWADSESFCVSSSFFRRSSISRCWASSACLCSSSARPWTATSLASSATEGPWRSAACGGGDVCGAAGVEDDWAARGTADEARTTARTASRGSMPNRLMRRKNAGIIGGSLRVRDGSAATPCTRSLLSMFRRPKQDPPPANRGHSQMGVTVNRGQTPYPDPAPRRRPAVPSRR